MGLDMYLMKAKRVNGFVAADYIAVDNCMYDLLTPSGSLPADLDFVRVTGIPNANELLDEVHDEGTFFTWKTIFREAGYWRKANQIHSWFVKNVQGGVDDCGHYEVTKEHLEALRAIVTEIMAVKDNPSDLVGQYRVAMEQEFDPEKAESLLPTQSGFFFGSTEYDEWYLEDLKLTLQIIDATLADTDFEKQVLFYHSSW